MVLVDPVVLAPDADLAKLPTGAAVYVIRPRQGDPYIGRTNILRRRLMRLFDKWRLREHAERVEYWSVGSKLEQWLVSYAAGRALFPDDYSRVLKLPKPSYVKLLQHGDFPRLQVTARLGGQRGTVYGPFVARANAEVFESQTLELFQIRRCLEDLSPSPSHPGCIYGEMRMCLRPCQEAVSRDEYAHEASRVAEFLAARGANLLSATAAARDRCSANLDFEEAARQHARHERIEALIKNGGELAHEVTRLHGVAVTASHEPMHVELWFLRGGCWTGANRFSVAPGIPEPLDKRLRALVQDLAEPREPVSIRQDHLALLVKWHASSWRDGEWIGIEDWERPPYRRMVNAISRVAGGRQASLPFAAAP